MAEPVNKGRRDLPSLNQTSLREAVCSTVASHRNGWSDQDMADEWGVSAGTVNNAQNKRHDLGLMPWLRLGKRFGPDALSTTLALIGAKAVADSDITLDVSQVPCDIAGVLPLFIELFRDGTCCDADVRRLEDAGAIEAILGVADFLRQRRDDVRLRAVK